MTITLRDKEGILQKSLELVQKINCLKTYEETIVFILGKYFAQKEVEEVLIDLEIVYSRLETKKQARLEYDSSNFKRTITTMLYKDIPISRIHKFIQARAKQMLKCHPHKDFWKSMLSKTEEELHHERRKLLYSATYRHGLAPNVVQQLEYKNEVVPLHEEQGNSTPETKKL